MREPLRVERDERTANVATLVDTRPKVLSDEELWSVMTRYAGHPDVMSVFATMNAIRQSRQEANVTETEEVERVCWTVINGQPCVLDADHAGGHQSADTALSIAQKRIDELERLLRDHIHPRLVQLAWHQVPLGGHDTNLLARVDRVLKSGSQ